MRRASSGESERAVFGQSRQLPPRGLTQDMVVLAQRFALLMGQYADCLGDGRISHNEAMHLLRETLALQEVLMEMKLNLETEISRATG